MHLSQGELRAYQDRELPPAQIRRVESHLSSCERCRAQADSLLATSDMVAARLNSISPSRDPLRPGLARLRLEERIHGQAKEYETMFARLFSRLPRPAWAALITLVLLAGLMAFAPVRAIANSFLGLFRVERISVIEIDPSQLPEQMGESAQFQEWISSDVQIESDGDSRRAADAAEASSLAGYTVRLPNPTPDGLELRVEPGGRATMTIDLKKVQAILDEFDRSDIQLPPEIDGAEVVLEIGAAVQARFGDCRSGRGRSNDFVFDPDNPQAGSFTTGCTILMQMPSPEINAPEGLDLFRLGQAYLQIAGMSQSEAEAFSQSVDWTTTLVLPIPATGATHREVQVDGVTGTLIERIRTNGQADTMLIWVKDGMLYGLTGSDPAGVLELANSLQ